MEIRLKSVMDRSIASVITTTRVLFSFFLLVFFINK